MARRIKFRIGYSPDKSYVDVWGSVEVVPKELKSLPRQLQAGKPGYDFQIFDDQLNPLPVKVKAGTQGTVGFHLAGDYYFKVDMNADMPHLQIPHTPLELPNPELPVPKSGTVYFGGTTEYSCTKEGELSFGHYFSEDSKVEDDFKVTIQSFQPQPKTAMIIAKAAYSGSGTTGDITLPRFYAEFAVTDKVLPPRPPVPIPRYPPALMTIIPFAKEGQRTLDGAAGKIASDWATGMFKTYPELRDPMMHGKIPLSMVGYASKTGPIGEKDEQKIDKYDVDIGAARASNVQTYLTPYLGSKADFAYVSVGRQQAQWAQLYDEKLKKMVEVVGKPRDIDRVVVVWVDYETVLKILNPKK